MLDGLSQIFGEIFGNASPSGGMVGLAVGAALLASALFKFASEQFREIMKSLFADSWQAVIALAVASGGFLLLADRYYTPAILGLVAVAACLWASRGKRKLAEGAKLGRISMSGFPVASLVLMILFPVYVTAHLVEKQFAGALERKLLEQEHTMTVAFILPSYNRSEDLDEQSALELEKEFFKQIYRTLHESPLMNYNNVDVRPMSVPAAFHDLKSRRL